MTLNPLEEFVIARQLNDPNDVGTYYVRAFIRNAKTDVLIATLNLVDKGSQRFTKTWQVPQDPTGLGFFITVTSLVYTDLSYSTLSTTYGSEQHEFLVQDRINPYLGGGADVDYKRIRKIIQEELIKLPKAELAEKFDYETLAKGFEAVILEVKDIKLPESDLRPVVRQIEGLEAKIKAIKIPETDLSPVLKAIKEPDLSGILESLQEIYDCVEELKKKEFPELDVSVLEKKLDTIHEIIDEPQKQAEQKKAKTVKSREILKEYLNGT